MNKDSFEVWIGNDRVAAHMDKDIALLLIDAIFSEYYNEKTLSITIKKEMVAETGLDN